jgi:perosamine synthetase
MLALNGDKPVREQFLPYARQSLDDADIAAVVDVLKSDWLTTGPKVAEFEERLADYVGARYAVSFSSGTAALHGAAFAAELSPGDEAITTPMTFCATANSILYQGAAPVFADVEPDTLNIDPHEVARKITSRTKAIIAVDYAGHPAPLPELRTLAHAHRAVLIEDASHALGAKYGDKRVGSQADMTVFSFHPVKHLTTGEGGMVSTDNARLTETLRRFRSHGISTDSRERHQSGQWSYEMVLLGFNYKLTDVACALGLSQIDKLDSNLTRRRAIASRYATSFSAMPAITVPAVRDEVDPAWHLYPIRLNLEELTVGRDEILRALRAENIGANVHYLPVHLHTYYRERFKGTECYPVAESAYDRLISLPMFPAMHDRDVDDVIKALTRVLTYYERKASAPLFA